MMNSHLISEGSVFLNEEEVIHSRMATFHQRRAEQALAGATPVGKSTNGILLVHLFPNMCFQSRKKVDIAQLVGHLQSFIMFSADISTSSSIMPNVDGVLCKAGYSNAYMQCYRNLAFEAGKSDFLYLNSDRKFVMDYRCEKAIYGLMHQYKKLTKAMEIEWPVTLFSSLIGCDEAGYYPGQYGFDDGTRSVVGQKIATLPSVQFDSVDADLHDGLKEWNDYLSQALGKIKSHNYNEKGEWRART